MRTSERSCRFASSAASENRQGGHVYAASRSCYWATGEAFDAWEVAWLSALSGTILSGWCPRGWCNWPGDPGRPSVSSGEKIGDADARRALRVYSFCTVQGYCCTSSGQGINGMMRSLRNGPSGGVVLRFYGMVRMSSHWLTRSSIENRRTSAPATGYRTPAAEGRGKRHGRQVSDKPQGRNRETGSTSRPMTSAQCAVFAEGR